MGAMSIGHWLIVLVVVLLVFGPKRLGDVGKGRRRDRQLAAGPVVAATHSPPP